MHIINQWVSLGVSMIVALSATIVTAQTPLPLDGTPEVGAVSSVVKPLQSGATENTRGEHIYADIETSKGMIEAELDFRRAPLTVLNFVGLSEGTLPFKNRTPGMPFYDGLTFHRVVSDFVVQGGDPLSADPAAPKEKLGDGGPGYSFPDEFSPALRHDTEGVLSMANDGPDTNGSQFFITLHETNRLNYLHSVFGRVVDGMVILEHLAPGDKILHVSICRVGPGAEAFQASGAIFDKLKIETLSERHSVPASFNYLVDGTNQLPEFRVKNFNFKLANYERTTGHRIAVRLVPEMKSDDTGQSVGGTIKNIAGTLGLPDTGDNVLLCYFASIDSWGLRLGEATYPALIGQHGTTEQLMASGAMHDKKLALVASAQAETKLGKIKEGVDAAIDSVIKALDDFTLQNADRK